jgi:2,3-dihydroxy-p-cumate/2,3-dihydroxybenzoate 3,4-dioxygenase
VIRHVVLFRFRPEVSEGEQRAILDELRSFPSRYPAMQRFALGENRSRRDQTFPFAMHIEFPGWAELDAYLESSTHETFVRERFAPVIQQRAIASIETDPETSP